MLLQHIILQELRFLIFCIHVDVRVGLQAYSGEHSSRRPNVANRYEDARGYLEAWGSHIFGSRQDSSITDFGLVRAGEIIPVKTVI